MPRLDKETTLRLSAWTLVFLGSLLNLLNHNEYPLFSLEVALAALLIVAAALLGAFVHRLAVPRLSFIFTGLLVLIAADLNSDRLEYLVAAFLVGLVIAWRWEEMLLKIVSAAFVGVIFFQLVQGQWALTPPPALAGKVKAAPRQGDLPPIVHIIFDAYLGIEGMSEDEEAFAELERTNLDFFQERGFRLYGGAFSRHRNTANSVPQTFSFGKAPLATAPQRFQRSLPGELPYLTLLAERGYRTHVLQSDYIDLCTGQRIASCTSFRRVDLSAVAETRLSTRDRAVTIALTFARLGVVPAVLVNAGSASWGKLTGTQAIDLDRLTKLAPIASMKVMPSLEAALAKAQPGDAYVAHLLMPHDPFLFDADCSANPREEWAFEEAPVSRRYREQRYARQMKCVLSQLDRLLQALGRSPAGRDSIVIVHGDHGSRIADGVPQIDRPQASRRDYAMNYSTLFAVRAPSVPAGYEPRRAAIELLLRDFSGSEFRNAIEPMPEAHHVILTDDVWIPRRKATLPAYGRPF